MTVERGDAWIVIRGAREHNLKGIDLEIPRDRLTVITGVSGSGKSSLAFDTVFREGQRRFLETLPSFARQFGGGFARAAVTSIEGLGPAVAVGQRASLSNPRSTVGTLTEVWDLLRLLFARLGSAPEGIRPTRGLFSFNGAEGACPSCQGLGVEDRLDLDLLVADASRTLREGALRVSTPNGYLMYSQITLAVLDEVLRAHGGSVDIPWRDLPEEVRRVVLYGSERLKVPYGKHPLESRLKWTGITARPRPEGFYRGLVPVMEEILRGKRNDSILRFVRTSPCGACGGTRLRPEALAVTWAGRRITDLAALTAAELETFLREFRATPREAPVLEPIRADILGRCELMRELGLGYLGFDRPAPSLSLGEVQRLRLLTLALGELRGLLVVLDEPSAGLHPHDVGRLLQVLRRLRDQGQTVVVVEHDATLARSADWLIDLGPGPGVEGGELLWCGPPGALVADTPTGRWLAGGDAAAPREHPCDGEVLGLEHLARHNLQDLAIQVREGALNVVSGVSGAGKTTLLGEAFERLQSRFKRALYVDAQPIGRTPRSNAATYSGAFDLIRDLFAATPGARAKGLGKGHFTFNTAGGRCEACEGAGVVEVGMRHLGSVDLVCDACGGRRFHEEVLAVAYRGRSIADVLEGSLQEAAELFADQPKLRRILGALLDCGLGYLPLGQPATTLSGGEAQRVKLATELARAGSGASLIALDEPTTGLHAADVAVLLAAWERLLRAGHTLLVVENDPVVIRAADHVLDLGPGGGPEGGRVVVQGTPAAVAACPESLTGAVLRGEWGREEAAVPRPVSAAMMELQGVATHNLKDVDVAFPARGWTAVTGPSGSGKSSLVFDTLLAESQNRFSDLVAPWARRLLPRRGGAELAGAKGLQAAVAVTQQRGRRNPRSRVGTLTEIDELLRMVFARAGTGGPLLASVFSPNSEAGACPQCKGLGFIQACDPVKLVSHPERPLTGGALDGTRFGAYLGEPHGQFVATLRAAGTALGMDFERPWRELGEPEKRVAMHGAGEGILEVEWHYQRGRSVGVHRLSTPWAGFAALVDREYERVHLKAGPESQGEALEALLSEGPCPECQGERLRQESRAATFGGRRLPELSAMPLEALTAWLAGCEANLPVRARQLTQVLRTDITRRLDALVRAGLGYLSLDREMATLSGGEAQRVRLASALGGGLVGVTYVLDEPSRGLHPRDVDRLAGVLRNLADEGNAVVVVEHNPALVAPADHVIELGPGSGAEGGRITAAGAPVQRAASVSPQGGRGGRLSLDLTPGITVRKAHLHNLQDMDVVFPVGVLTVVAGVSGSGKSSLVQDVLGASLQEGRPVGCEAVIQHVDLPRVLRLEQEPGVLGGTSTVATLAGIAEALRKRFAATPEAKIRKLTAKHFSTSSPGGRCEACEGRGAITVAMDLLPDVVVGCEVCGGRRFLGPVLECRVEGLDIAQAMELSLGDAERAFHREKAIGGPLRALCGIGLGYLRLGQEGRTLSTGEHQRLRLAGLLAEAERERIVILLDEPTRGLGREDVDRLVQALYRLAAQGHLLVVVEHDLQLLAAADWILELGPEGGPGGGRIVAQGPPLDLAERGETPTGRALREVLRG